MNPPERIDAITLDLDDTLWPVEPVIRHAEQALQGWFAEHAPAVLADNDARSLGEVRRRVFAENPHLLHDFSALRRIAIAELLTASGYDLSLAADAFETFFAARNAVSLYDDVVEGLARLASRFPLVAVTNGNAELARMDIGIHFRTTVFAREVGRPKPDAAMFEAALAHLDTAPDRVVHVGDHLEHDVAGALGAGLQAVWIDRSGTEPEESPPVRRVTCLRELADLLGC